MKLSSSTALFSLLASTAAHMALSEPAPRRSPNHPGYTGGNIDYDITTPLGSGAYTPCKGAPIGPVYKTYKAGSDIDVHITGGASHSGGICQFSVSYDQIHFAVLKTVNDCISTSVDYKVTIPRDAPNGNAIFAWTWFNKVGNREMYMNCVDVDIAGGSDNGSITGKQMTVANLQGYPTLPEGYTEEYAKQLFDSQPTITVAPVGTSTPVHSSTLTLPKITQVPTNPPSMTSPNRQPSMTSPTRQPSSSQGCIQGTFICKSVNTIGVCWDRAYYYRSCPRGTQCSSYVGYASCE
ncbi:hypothetical protein DSO57_1038474 [Entomophthora muscae]|uniref:Uncharacterized protein n=2 Tax=Entomophthora muscae TaxID=34485 RepID=A0ACC2UI82_9FUNG|nr:hypothetical protein DSO57_1000424 [Entomophthora muscae]KAJ9086930.1 hypothetical protein DSO57_1038474 [Entomophthora muscae]